MPLEKAKTGASVKLRFSDFFGIPHSAVKDFGAFDVSLVSDLPLFVDPFLLFNSKKNIYKGLHSRIIKYLVFLRDQALKRDLDTGLIKTWYTFPEVRETWLGFTRSGNTGRGLGSKFANSLYGNLNQLFSDFGDEQITKGSHLEKLCLIDEGIGRDNISDFTTNLIKEHLLEFTQEFAHKYLSDHQVRRFSVSKVRFEYDTQSWQPGEYTLPVFDNAPIILTPRDILTKDNTWINRPELIEEFWSIPDSIPNDALRAQINNYFLSCLPKKPKKPDRHKAAIATIQKFPIIVDYFIKEKEASGKRAESISEAKVRFSEHLYLENFGQFAALLNNETPFYKIKGDTCDEARQRIGYLKDVIENKGGHKLFYLDGEPIKKEEDTHIAYRLTWFGTPSDVSREVNDGRGPADFKISRGSKDKAIVEFKLASNSQLKKNLKKQAEIYAKASDAKCSIKVIVYFSKGELAKVQRILKELGLKENEDLILIDARKDNKPSGSKAA